MSVMWHPCASLMKSGVPPTALNARTGDDTPPGIRARARANASSDFAVDRCAGDSDMAATILTAASKVPRQALALRGRFAKMAFGFSWISLPKTVKTGRKGAGLCG